MDISVIIVNWNTRDLLRRCLDSLVATAGSLAVEVIVVDNDSHDGSQDMLCADYPFVTLIQNSANVGFARANNQGATHASAPLLLLLNSDAAVLPHALDRAVEFMRTHVDIGILGLQLLNDDLTLQVPGERFPTLISTIIGLLPLPTGWGARCEQRRSVRDYSRMAYVDTVCGAALMVRRDLFEALGRFDERFYFTSEEVDLCWRASESGSRVAYLPAAQVVHSIGGARARVPSLRQGLVVQRGRYMLLQRHKPMWQALVLRGYIALFTAARLLRVGLRVRRQPPLVTHTAAHSFARELLWLLHHQ